MFEAAAAIENHALYSSGQGTPQELPVRGGPYEQRWGTAHGGVNGWNYSVYSVTLRPTDGELAGSVFTVEGHYARVVDPAYELRFFGHVSAGASPDAVASAFTFLATSVANETPANVTRWAADFVGSKVNEEDQSWIKDERRDLYRATVFANLRLGSFLESLHERGIEERQDRAGFADLVSGNITVDVSFRVQTFRGSGNQTSEDLEVDRNDFASYWVQGDNIRSKPEAFASLRLMLENLGLPGPEIADVRFVDAC